MKTTFLGCILLVMTSANALAADALKIGYVRVDKILTQAPQVDAIKTKLTDRFGGKTGELKELETEIKGMQDDYKRNELVMTEDKLAELRKSLIAKMQSYKQKETVLSQEVATARNQELSVLQDSIRTIIQDIAKSDGYDLVLSEGVVYADKGLDISDKILAKMKNEFESGKK